MSNIAKSKANKTKKKKKKRERKKMRNEYVSNKNDTSNRCSTNFFFLFSWWFACKRKNIRCL